MSIRAKCGHVVEHGEPGEICVRCQKETMLQRLAFIGMKARSARETLERESRHVWLETREDIDALVEQAEAMKLELLAFGEQR